MELSTTVSSSFITGDKTRLRYVISNSSSTVAAKKYQIEYASGSCTTWTPIPRVSDLVNQHFRMETSNYVADNTVTAHKTGLTVPGGKTFTAGKLQTFSSSTQLVILTSSQYTELEYNLRSTSYATPNVTYCFRLTDNGDASAFTYSATATLTVLDEVIRRQSNGGGGYNASSVEIEAPSAVSAPAQGGATGHNGGTSSTTETIVQPQAPQATTTPTKVRGGSEDVGLLQRNDTFAASSNYLRQGLLPGSEFGNSEPAGSGMVLGATSDSMCVDLKHRMLYGESDTTTGGEVSQVQYYLKLRGYFNGKVTGLYLDRTKEAIKQFQKDNDLIVTGIAGKVTRAKMAELGCQVSSK